MPNAVVRAMGEILQLRGGPQNLPTSYPLLAGASVVFLVCSLLIFRLQGMTGGLPLLQALVSYAVLFGFLQAALRMRHLGNRLPQTLTALLLAGCFFSVLAYWPVSVLLPYMAKMKDSPTVAAPVGPTVLMLVLGVWSLAVQTHILRVAMELRILAAFGLVLVYEILSVLVVNALFGQAAAPVG